MTRVLWTLIALTATLALASIGSDGVARGALIMALVLLAGTTGALVYRNGTRRNVEIFGPNFREGEYISEYYEFMPRLFQEAVEDIHISGAGFDYSTKHGSEYASNHLTALNDALERGVRVRRLQTTRDVAEEWIEGLRLLKERHPRKFRLFLAIYDRTDFADVTVVDSAHRNSCSVEAALSTPGTDGQTPIDRVSIAMVIRRRQILARNLVDRLNRICSNEAEELRNPAEFASQFGPVYHFAFGSNIASDQMSRRCRSAEPLGYAEVQGYELAFNVHSARWNCGVANLVPSPGRSAPGLLWKISRSDVKNLDEMETDLYTRTAVEVHIRSGGETKRYPAMAYVAKPEAVSASAGKPSAAYLEKMQSGAKAHDFPKSWWDLLAVMDVL